MIKNICALAINQYNCGEHQDALWTFQKLDKFPQSGDLRGPDILAYSAMTLSQLGRMPEAMQALTKLRILLKETEITDETCLYKAERNFASHNTTFVSIWELVEEDRLDDALCLLNEVKQEQNTEDTMEGEALQSIRGALARAYCRSAIIARHEALGPQREMSLYQAALRADPNHVPALQHLALHLAICPDTDLRNGKKALTHAQRACELSDFQDVQCLASLAAACAECGDFFMAAQWQKKALKHLPEHWSNQELKAKLSLYESGQHQHTEHLRPFAAWWPITVNDDEKILDASGSGLHGTFMGDARIVTDPKRGHVLALDGEGDWVDCGHDKRFNLTQAITVSVWIKTRASDTRWQSILSKGSSWVLSSSESTVGFSCQGPDIRTEPGDRLTGNKAVVDDQWHQVVGVYDGDGIYQYIDGVLNDSVRAAGQIHLNEQTLYIGKGRSINSKWKEWNGWLDDVRIYNYALSQAEIRALYADK